jgi:hypothetical protein
VPASLIRADDVPVQGAESRIALDNLVHPRSQRWLGDNQDRLAGC